ncbi:hypothetical protein [Pectobacterium brasiliense]|uniref:hypothetical protein n=1 Tax=Pectobacterium brasiliense TaxID=180957 RepID=UPI001F07E9A3|nr:hypothetical protein [Pectobacterium brasiliense]
MRGKWRKYMHVVFVGLIMMSTATAAEEEPLRIRSVFDINSAFCAIKTNGVLGMDNRHSAVAGRGFGTSSTNALLFLENGENDITVEIGALGWFSKEAIGDEERKAFKPDAKCKVALTAFKGEQSRVLSQLTIAIGQDGIPYVPSGGETDSAKAEKVAVKKSLRSRLRRDIFLIIISEKIISLSAWNSISLLKKSILRISRSGNGQELHPLPGSRSRFRH